MQQQLLIGVLGWPVRGGFVLKKNMGAEGLWLGLILGLTVAAILNFGRFYFQTKIDES